jgi:hypothetical protein
MAAWKKIKEGTRVLAPHPKDMDRPHKGTVVADLSIMYVVDFDNSGEEFVFKAARLETLE